MTSVKRNGNMQNFFPTVFEDLLNRNIFNWGLTNYSDTNTSIPAVNIKETASGYEVEMAAPGMDKKDFKIQLDGNTLTINSEKEEMKNLKSAYQYALREFSYESFSRTFSLQKDVVDTENIQARYDNGILRLSIPKKQGDKQKGTRTIEIS